MKKRGKRVYYRDEVIKDLKDLFPKAVLTKGEDANSFVMVVERLIFKTGWEFGDFYEMVGHTRAKIVFSVHQGRVRVVVSNYKGWYYKGS